MSELRDCDCAALKFCPVCVLNKAIASGVESGESFAGDTVFHIERGDATVSALRADVR